MLLWISGCMYLFKLVGIFFCSKPRNGIAGPYGNSICSFLKDLHTVSIPIYIPTNSVQEFLFSTSLRLMSAKWINKKHLKECLAHTECSDSVGLTFKVRTLQRGTRGRNVLKQSFLFYLLPFWCSLPMSMKITHYPVLEAKHQRRKNC